MEEIIERRFKVGNRGSEFRKWDLHIHSPYTVLNNNYRKIDGKPAINEFIRVIKENNISVIGLTNYFNFTEEDFILKEELEKEGVTTFLNLEVRLSNINKEDQLCDYHIIFDNTVDKEIIVNLLAKLEANTGSEKNHLIDFNLLKLKILQI